MARMADAMVSDPSLRPTTAMSRAGITAETEQRRLRRKWKQNSARHLEAARARREASHSKPAPHPQGAPSYSLGGGLLHYALAGLSGATIAQNFALFGTPSPIPLAMQRHNDLFDQLDRERRLMEQFERDRRFKEQIEQQQRLMEQADRYRRAMNQIDQCRRLADPLTHSHGMALGLRGY